MTTPQELRGLGTGFFNQDLVERIHIRGGGEKDETGESKYIYIRTAYGSIHRLNRKKSDELLKIFKEMRIARSTGATKQRYSYKELIMRAPEYALLIPLLARENPSLLDDEILNYYDECSQHIEDAAIAILSKSKQYRTLRKTKPEAKDVEPKPINLEDVE